MKSYDIMSNEINKKSENNFITVTNSHVKIELDSNYQNDIIEEKVTKSDNKDNELENNDLITNNEQNYTKSNFLNFEDDNGKLNILLYNEINFYYS